MVAETETKASKIGKAAVEAALADVEKAEAATLAEVRAAVSELESVLARVEASESVTAAKDRVADALQFVHAHFGVKA